MRRLKRTSRHRQKCVIKHGNIKFDPTFKRSLRSLSGKSLLELTDLNHFGIFGDLIDIIKYANFHIDQSRGFSFVGCQKIACSLMKSKYP